MEEDGILHQNSTVLVIHTSLLRSVQTSKLMDGTGLVSMVVMARSAMNMMVCRSAAATAVTGNLFRTSLARQVIFVDVDLQVGQKTV